MTGLRRVRDRAERDGTEQGIANDAGWTGRDEASGTGVRGQTVSGERLRRTRTSGADGAG